jgi:phage-related minor tail protein
MALASLSVDLTLALAKFEGDSGKAAQIITRDSEKMSRAARAVEAAFQKQQDQFKRTSTEALAVQAAQAGLIDTSEKLAKLSEQEGTARASKAAAEGYTAASVAAQSYEQQLAALNAQERQGLLEINALYRQKRDAIREQGTSGAITSDKLKADLANARQQRDDAITGFRAARDQKAAELEISSVAEQGAIRRAAAIQKLTDAQNGLSASYRTQLQSLRALRDAGDITPAKFREEGAKLVSAQPVVQQRQAEVAAAQKVIDANNGISASYRQQLKDLEALLAKDKLTGPEFLQAKTKLVEQQPAFVSQQKQIAEEKAAAAAVVEGTRLRANAFQAMQARIEVLTTGYVKLGDTARQATQNDAEIEAGNRFIQNLNAQVFAIGKTREEKLRLEAAAVGRSQQAEPLITGLGKAELTADIAAQTLKVRALREEFGKTAAEILQLRAAQQGTGAENAAAIAALQREQKAYEDVAAAARRADEAKAASDGFVARVQAEIAAQQKLAAEFGKTEIEILQLEAAQRGLGESLAPAIAQLKALKEANASLGGVQAPTTPADQFIRDLVREREEIGKTREELLTLRAARAGVNAGVAAAEIKATGNTEFVASIEAQILTQRRLSEEFGKTATEVLALRAAEKGLTTETAAAIAELQRLTTANQELAAAKARQDAVTSGNTAFLAQLEREAVAAGKTRVEILQLQAAERGLSKEAEAAIAKIAAFDARTGQLGKSAFASRNQLLTLQYTIGDIAASAASGISPLTILLQQGGQVIDAFTGPGAQGGGVGAFFKGLLSFVTPLRLALGGVAAAATATAFAFYEGSKQSKAFADSLVLTGGYAGVTEGQFNALAKSVAATGEISASTARKFGQALISTGEVGPRVLGSATEAAARYGAATGKTAQEVAGDFASMSRDVVAWATEHNRSLNFLSVAQFRQIRTLQEQGRAAEAQGIVYDALNLRFRGLEDNLTGLDKLLRGTANLWDKFWDAATGTGRAQTVEENLKRAIALQATLAKTKIVTEAPANGPIAPENTGDAANLRQGTEAAKAKAAADVLSLSRKKLRQDDNAFADAERASDTKDVAAFQERLKGLLVKAKSGAEYQKALNKIQEDFRKSASLGDPVSETDQKAALAQLKKDFTDTGAVSKSESEAERLRKARLASALKALEDELAAERVAVQFHNQELQAIYAAGGKSLIDFYAERNANTAKGVADELATLAAERKKLAEYRDLKTTSGSDKEKTQTEINASADKSAAIQIKAANDITLSNLEQVAAFKALGQQVNDYRASLAQLVGDEKTAADLRAQQQVAAARQLANQARPDIKTPGGVRRFESAPPVDVSGLQTALAITNDLAEAQRKVGIAAFDAARAETAFLLRATQDGLSLEAQEKQVFAIRGTLVDQLKVYADETEKLAQRERDAADAAGRAYNPKIIGEAADASLKYAQALDSVNPYITRLRGAGEDLGTGLAQIFSDAALHAKSFKDLLESIKDKAVQILVKEFYEKPLETAIQGQIRTFIDGGSGFAEFLKFGSRGNPKNDAGINATGAGFSAAKDTGLVGAASSVSGASADAAAATAATTASTGLTSVGTAASAAAPVISALTSEATTASLGVNAIGSESAASAIFISGFGDGIINALAAVELFASAVTAAAAKAAGGSAVSVFAKAKGDAFSGGSVMAFAEGNRFAADGIFPFAKGGAFERDAEPRAQKFAAGGQFTNRVVSQPTYFRFKDGGKSRLGLMGEAGPEAVVPLKRGGGVQGVQSYRANGRPGPVLALTRGPGGSLGVQAFAKGGAFASGTAGVRAFATGGSFYADPPSAETSPAKTPQVSGRAAGGGTNIVIENHGADIQKTQETGPDGREQVRLIIRQAVEQSRHAVAADIASRTGPAGVAMKAIGIPTGGNIPRRT